MQKAYCKIFITNVFVVLRLKKATIFYNYDLNKHIKIQTQAQDKF